MIVQLMFQMHFLCRTHPKEVDWVWLAHNYVDYTGRGGIHEAFLHKTSATDANAMRLGISCCKNVLQFLLIFAHNQI